jgi:hypothetical protein
MRSVRLRYKLRNALQRQSASEERLKMKLTKTLILCAVPVLLASCATPNTDACAGWRPILIAPETLDYLAENDKITLKALIAHQEFGLASGCW